MLEWVLSLFATGDTCQMIRNKYSLKMYHGKNCKCSLGKTPVIYPNKNRKRIRATDLLRGEEI